MINSTAINKQNDDEESFIVPENESYRAGGNETNLINASPETKCDLRQALNGDKGNDEYQEEERQPGEAPKQALYQPFRQERVNPHRPALLSPAYECRRGIQNHDDNK